MGIAIVLFWWGFVAVSVCDASVGAWGTFNPGSLFSLRKAAPDSPLVGIGWSRRDRPKELRIGVGDPSGPTYFRGHDGVSFASEVITDQEAGVVVTATWVAVNDSSWLLRVRGDPLDEEEPRDVHFFVYTSLLQDVPPEDPPKGDLVVHVEGGKQAVVSSKQSSIGEFRVEVREPRSGVLPKERKRSGQRVDLSTDMTRFHHVAVRFQEPHRPEKVIAYLLAMDLEIQRRRQEESAEPAEPLDIDPVFPDKSGPDPNLAVVQRLLRTPFEFDVDFGTSLGAEEITSRIAEAERSFELRFTATFGLERRNFDANAVLFAQQMLSNLLGGIGFFHGTLPISVPRKEEEDDDGGDGGERATETSSVQSLFSATPSRRSFPRGFLWDEGFHQLLIQRWDQELSKAMLTSWFDTMTATGWIPREQTRGADAVSRFPAHIPHFMVQSPDVVNPPTLLMAALAIRQAENVQVEADGRLRRSPFVEYAFTQLSQHVQFLASSQQSRTDDFRFYWRGRSESDGVVHTLASGLDDYPRAAEISDQERHLDLTCWIAWALRAVAALAPPEQAELAGVLVARSDAVRGKMDGDLAAPPPSKLLCDYGRDGPVCHDGYVSLFPLLLGLEPPASPRVGALLDLMEDAERLWSVGGLRSLSKSDPEYGKQDGYWTGPVWLPINYLALAALRTKYGVEEGPFRERSAELYARLRRQIVANVLADFEATGTVWEQYHPETGRGQRGDYFTGWSALIVLIMAEQYDGVIVP